MFGFPHGKINANYNINFFQRWEVLHNNTLCGEHVDEQALCYIVVWTISWYKVLSNFAKNIKMKDLLFAQCSPPLEFNSTNVSAYM